MRRLTAASIAATSVAALIFGGASPAMAADWASSASCPGKAGAVRIHSLIVQSEGGLTTHYWNSSFEVYFGDGMKVTTTSATSTYVSVTTSGAFGSAPHTSCA